MSKTKAGDDSTRSRKRARVDRQQVEENHDESDISDTDKFSDDEEGGIRIDDIYIPPAPPPVCSYESTGPRLIITHIVNENFKSYAGRVLVGPFDKSFSSIVGPNGSGKSNVIDSMLFVFGYRATKIRSKKVSVLIHKSERHQNITSCKVEVHFAQIIDKDNGDYEKVPHSEFVIARTAFQNSSSFYELNHKRVQFKEVAMTLRKHGIDLIHNRFLILQGEVEQIALMKPKAQSPHETGMLEYLEDIIGTTRFKEPIEKLQARIEALNEERQEKLNRLKVVESEREALKGPMEETVNFLKTENRITHLRNKKLQLQMHKTNKSIEEIQKEKEELEEILKNLNDKLKELHDQKGTEKAEMDALNKTLNKMTKKYEELNEINQNAEKKNTGLTEEYKQLRKTQKKTAENLKTEEEKLKSLLKIPEENQEEIEKLSEEEIVLNRRRQEEEAAFQAVMSGLQKETKTFQVEKDKLQAEQIKLKKKHDDMRSAYELAKSERDIYVSSEQTEKAKLEQLVQKLNEYKESLRVKKTELTELQKELPNLEGTLQKAEEGLKLAKNKESEVTNNLRKYQSQLEEKKCAMSANRSRNRVLDFLMNKKMQGEIPGIFGRLGDLGAIDKKYDVAVSTACSFLDHIIVDHTDTIAPCIQALKVHNVGRAHFLALNKFQDEYMKWRRTRFDAPNKSTRLVDLIRVDDERVLPAFYKGLYNTLVADTLDDASRIAYGTPRHRVVTLNGELIDPSGTMSGGGHQQARGRMGTQVSVATDPHSVEEVNALERRVSVLEEQLQTIRNQEQAEEETISRLGPDMRTKKMDVNKLTIEIQGLSKQVPELENRIKNQQKKVKECAPNEQRLQELSSKVETTEKSARKAEQEANKIEEKVNAVHEKIMEITGGKTKEAQKKLDDVTKRWEKTRSTITQLQVAIKTSERNAKKAKERMENMKVELEEAEKREAEIQEEKETVKNDCKISSEKAAQLKEEMEEKQSRLSELQEEHKHFMQEVNKLKASKVKEEQKLEAVEKKMNEIGREIPAIRHKLEKLTLHKIPVFNEPAEEDEEPNNENQTPDAPEKPADNPEESGELLTYDAETLDEVSSSEINAQLQKDEEYLKTLTPNLNTLNDYEKKTRQFIERSNELKEITERRNLCRQGYEEARKNRLQEFMSSFTIISNKLKELYQMLTMGGDAELDLHDSLDPFTEGINFCVRPPKKSWKNITNLSGGEKTLSSLALVFALHYYRPTPLYVMDEIDAALDFKNVSIVGYYIKERTKNAQFIVISLRTNMFELANMLTGIYKTYNCTKTVTIKPDDLRHEIGGPVSQQNDKAMPPPPRVCVSEIRKRKTKRLSEERQEVRKEPQKNRDAGGDIHDNTDLSAINRYRKENELLREIESRENAKKNPVQSCEQLVNADDDIPSDTDTDLAAIDRDPDEAEILAALENQNKNKRPTRGAKRADVVVNDQRNDSETDLSAIDRDSNESDILREYEDRQKNKQRPIRGTKPRDEGVSGKPSDSETDLSAIDRDSNESEIIREYDNRQKNDKRLTRGATRTEKLVNGKPSDSDTDLSAIDRYGESDRREHVNQKATTRRSPRTTKQSANVESVNREPTRNNLVLGMEMQMSNRRSLRAIRKVSNADHNRSHDDTDLSGVDHDSNESELLREITTRENRDKNKKKGKETPTKNTRRSVPSDAETDKTVEDSDTDVSGIERETNDRRRNTRKETPKKTMNRLSSSSAESDKENKNDSELEASSVDQDSNEGEILNENERPERDTRRQRTSKRLSNKAAQKSGSQRDGMQNASVIDDGSGES